MVYILYSLLFPGNPSELMINGTVEREGEFIEMHIFER